ncbi:hypothetical protein P12x_002256 [Tundrisphaera lichenicola]|uniref:hypothetical protein n=1 Tax=Tundrisphaera lichenicola TaxID=2029860 RepID=UPI003EB945F2
MAEMTESEWASSPDPELMLRFLLSRVRDERLRLFACGLCRRIWHLLADGSRHAVRVAERYAQGRASPAQLEHARWRAEATLNRWQAEEYVAESDAGFCYDETYCVVAARLYAAYAALAVSAADPIGSVVRYDEYFDQVEWTHAWTVAARADMARACVFEAIRGPERGTIVTMAEIWAHVAQTKERKAQADLLREIIDYPGELDPATPTRIDG